jgi:hypothetical protein
MAVIQSVREFGRELTSRCGAPAGTIETYIEVPFENGKFRPDDLIRVTRGKTEWTALVEVKTPWDRVVNVEGKRPVKIDGGCPNKVCVLGDW